AEVLVSAVWDLQQVYGSSSFCSCIFAETPLKDEVNPISDSSPQSPVCLSQ
ncbi:uncharacterized, partial [Tachysurus ichikawai]